MVLDDRINIVCQVGSNWILERLARGLAERIPGAHLVDQNDLPTLNDKAVKLNYYINDYAMRQKKTHAVDVVFYDHPKGGPYVKQADCVVAMCPKYQREVERIGKKCFRVTQPTDMEMFQPKLKLGFVGRFAGQTDYSHRKGKSLIDRVAQIPWVDLRLTLGKLPESDLPEFYRGLDATLVTSLVEGGPMCLTESLACGVPVVIPSTVGVAELFQAGTIDYKAGDYDALYAVLERLYAEKLSRRRLVERYTWDSWAWQHYRIFREILGRPVRTCLYTTAIGEYGEDLGRYSIPLLQRYTLNNNMDLHVFREQNEHMTPSWVRMECQQHMRDNQYDYGVYVDLDCMIDPFAPNILESLPITGWDVAMWDHGEKDSWNPQEAQRNISAYCKDVGIPLPDNYDGKQYYNAGVMCMSDGYAAWQNTWPESKTGCQDQNKINLGVITGELKCLPLSRAWNYGHEKTIPQNIYDSVHIVHCNQPDIAPCVRHNKRTELMLQASAALNDKFPRRIVYTVNTGGYDTVEPPKWNEPNTRYLLFSDGPHAEYKDAPRLRDAAPKILMATVVSGKKYREVFSLIEPLHRAYAEKIHADYRVISSPIIRMDWPSPSWWKMELSKAFEEGYQAVVFLDGDAWPWPWAGNIVDAVPRGKFGAFNSFTLPYMATPTCESIRSFYEWQRKSKREVINPLDKGFYINGGVWVCWSDALEILNCSTPVESPKYYEQHQLNHNLYCTPDLYHELGREWNYGHLHMENAEVKCCDRSVNIAHMSGVSVNNRLAVVSRLFKKTNVIPIDEPQKPMPSNNILRIYFATPSRIQGDSMAYIKSKGFVPIVATQDECMLNLSDLERVSVLPRNREIKKRLETLQNG